MDIFVIRSSAASSCSWRASLAFCSASRVLVVLSALSASKDALRALGGRNRPEDRALGLPGLLIHHVAFLRRLVGAALPGQRGDGLKAVFKHRSTSF
jgi:hypothetical protein